MNVIYRRMEKKLINGTSGTSELGNTKPTRARSRAYCFTLNNYSEEEYDNIKAWAQENSIGWIIGKEVGENGTPHLQGYISFKNPTEFASIKRVAERAHIEKAKGKKKITSSIVVKKGNMKETE